MNTLWFCLPNENPMGAVGGEFRIRLRPLCKTKHYLKSGRGGSIAAVAVFWEVHT